MGKGGTRTGKGFFSRGKTNTNNENQTTNSTGSMLSNFGFGAGVGAGVRCDASDDSFFCQLTKLTSMISQFIFLISILVLVYIGFKFIARSTMRGGKRRR